MALNDQNNLLFPVRLSFLVDSLPAGITDGCLILAESWTSSIPMTFRSKPYGVTSCLPPSSEPTGRPCIPQASALCILLQQMEPFTSTVRPSGHISSLRRKAAYRPPRAKVIPTLDFQWAKKRLCGRCFTLATIEMSSSLTTSVLP